MSLPFKRSIPFVEHLGVTLEAFGDGKARLQLQPLDWHANTLGMTHGGVLLSLMDVCMAHAARSVLPDSFVVTVELKTSFMQAAEVTPGRPLQAEGVLLHRTGSMAFTGGRIFNADGLLCAHATGTFRYVRHSPSKAGDVSA